MDDSDRLRDLLATRPEQHTIVGRLGEIANRLAAEPAEDFRESALCDPKHQRRFRRR